MVPGVSRAIFLLSTMASWGCSEPLSHVLLSTGTWASPEQGILPQQAEDAECDGSQCSSLSTEERLSCEWVLGFFGKVGEMGYAFTLAVMQ